MRRVESREVGVVCTHVRVKGSGGCMCMLESREVGVVCVQGRVKGSGGCMCTG